MIDAVKALLDTRLAALFKWQEFNQLNQAPYGIVF